MFQPSLRRCCCKFFVVTVVSSCRHPERSEGSRRSTLHPYRQTFSATISLASAFSNPATKLRVPHPCRSLIATWVGMYNLPRQLWLCCCFYSCLFFSNHDSTQELPHLRREPDNPSTFSHQTVKPKNHPSNGKQTTSTLPISFSPSVKLDTESKKALSLWPGLFYLITVTSIRRRL